MKDPFESNDKNCLGIKSLRKFREECGVSAVTTWRWTQRGWIHPINIAGKPYLTAEDLQQFNERATRGDFSKAPHGAAAKKERTR